MVIENFKELVEDVEIAVETLKEVEDPTINLRSALVEGGKFLTTLRSIMNSGEITEPVVEEEEEETDD